MKTAPELARRFAVEPTGGLASRALHPILRKSGRQLVCGVVLLWTVRLVLVLLGATSLLSPLHADCKTSYERAKKDAADVAASSRKVMLTKDQYDRRLGPGVYEKELALIGKHEREALEEARKVYDQCVAEEKKSKENADKERAADINREAEGIAEQVRGIKTDATGRDPGALRQRAGELKKQAQALEDQAFRQRQAGNYEQARALSNQASALSSGASRMESAAGAEEFKQQSDANKAKADAQQRQWDAESKAKDAKKDANKAAAKRIEEEVDRLRQQNSDFNPYTARGDPKAMREQAKQDREQARKLEEQSWQALRAGNYPQSQALRDAASELERRANGLEFAARNGESNRRREPPVALNDEKPENTPEDEQTYFDSAGSAVGSGKVGIVPRTLVNIAKEDVKALQKAYPNGAPRGLGLGGNSLQQAIENQGVWKGTPGDVGKVISGPMRGQIGGLLKSAPSPARESGSSGGYSAPAPPSGGSSWRGSHPAAGSDDNNPENPVDHVFRGLPDPDDRQQQIKREEETRINRVLNLLRSAPRTLPTDSPTTTPYDRIPSITPLPTDTPYDRVRSKPADSIPERTPYDRKSIDLRK